MTSTTPAASAAAAQGLLWTAARIEQHFDEVFADRRALGWTFEIEHLAPLSARVRLPFHQRNVRPGGVMSGPAMFHLADYGMWVAIIGMTGEAGVSAVTSNLAITYLRPAIAGDLIADVRVTKLGRRLAMGDVSIRLPGGTDMVAHATATYAMGESKNRVL